MTSVAIRLSSGGRSAGIASASDGRHELSVVVLPKMWASGSATLDVEWTDRRLVISGHELDTVRIHTTPEKRALVDALAANSYQEAVASSTERSPLIELVGGDKNRGPASRIRVGDVLALLRLQRHTQGSFGVADDQRFRSKTSAAWLLRPLVHLALVTELEPLLPRLRRGYATRDEVLTKARGRIDAGSVALLQATGVPHLRCIYEEFTLETPLAKALMSALDVVSAGTHTLGDGADRSLGEVRQRALVLRRSLASVPSMSRSDAVRALRTFRTDRFGRAWKGAVRLALMVLRAEAYVPDSGGGRDLPAFEMEIPTSTIWEDILEQVLAELLGGRRPSAQHPTPQPWQAAADKDLLPDFVFDNGETVWCVDAKYKRLRQGVRPAATDMYQLFAYSHLAKLDGRPVDRCGLLAPSMAREVQRLGCYTRNPPRDPNMILDVVSLPFPSPDDVRSRASWRAYVAEAAKALLACGVFSARASRGSAAAPSDDSSEQKSVAIS